MLTNATLVIEHRGGEGGVHVEAQTSKGTRTSDFAWGSKSQNHLKNLSTKLTHFAFWIT